MSALRAACRRSPSSTRASTDACPTSPAALDRERRSLHRHPELPRGRPRPRHLRRRPLPPALPRGHAGAAPGAKLVSVDVLDDDGMGWTSDVIAGADWILAHKDQYGIRVANFSLNGSSNERPSCSTRSTRRSSGSG